VLKHILAVEMRTLTVGTGDGVKNDELLRSKGLVQKGEAGMQTEEPVELERAAGCSGRGDCDFTAQSSVVGVRVRRHGRQTIEGAAQNNEHEARTRVAACEGDPARQEHAARGERSA